MSVRRPIGRPATSDDRLRRRLVRLATVRADPPHEALREHALERGGDEIVGNSEIEQARNRADRVVRVQRAEHQMPRHRRLHRDLGGLLIAHLADHHDIRILPQNGAQRGGERDARLPVHRHLRDARQLIFDRVFDRDDLFRDASRRCSAA